MVRKKVPRYFLPVSTSCDAWPCRPSNVHQRTSHGGLNFFTRNECNSDFANRKCVLLAHWRNKFAFFRRAQLAHRHHLALFDSLTPSCPSGCGSGCRWNFSTPCPMPWPCWLWCPLHAHSKLRWSWGERSASETASGLCTGRMRGLCRLSWGEEYWQVTGGQPCVERCKARGEI